MAIAVAYLLAVLVTAVAAYDALLLPYTAHMIVLACVCVYVGSQRSLDYEGLLATGEAVTPDAPKRVAMTSKDALGFPVWAGVGLVSLYAAFKYLDPSLVNTLLTGYFVLVGSVTLTNMLAPMIRPLLTSVTDPNAVLVEFVVPVIGLDVCISACDAAALPIVVPTLAAYVWTRHWALNNLLGISFCVEGIAQIATGDFTVSALLLVGVFVYDIYMVFFTPLMVAVATSVQGPIKLLLPRGHVDLVTGTPAQALLGLGDIVLPGIFIAMLARADALAEMRRRGVEDLGKPEATALARRIVAGDFLQPLFLSTLLWYAGGLFATVFVMIVFEAAQPALLYLVPATLIGALLAAATRGELSMLLRYKDDQYGAALRSCILGSAPAQPDTRPKEPADTTEQASASTSNGGVRRRK